MADVKTEKKFASLETAKKINDDVASLKEDISNKITKFYASNQGETHITDSDNGKIQDMMIYGKSSQDGTPSVENPVEIKSVVNPTVKVCGKNLLDFSDFQTKTIDGITFSSNGHAIHAKGTANKETTDDEIWIGYAMFNAPKGSKVASCQNAKLYLDKFEYINPSTSSLKTGDAFKCVIYLLIKNGETIDLDIELQMEFGSVATPYEPYHEQTVTLPYTLNAIPVSSGGNVTIDGQQYIADYVDVERGKLVKKLKSFTIADIKAVRTWGVNKNADNITGFYFCMSTNGLPKSNNEVMTSTILQYSGNAWGGNKVGCAVGSDTRDNYAILSVPTNTLEDISSDENACASLVKICENTNAIFFYSMMSSIETDLTTEQTQALKELVTYYPTTNIIVNSEQLDGYTVFNYPISMKNGWNYVKQQLNDNRDYIYDMDLQSAEAYVNSEYAVALTELEV